ncbi:MAG: orotidine-5'-phosphate decarboxylase [Acidimicrobiia bacterium]
MTQVQVEAPDEVRRRLVLALDVDDVVEAVRLVRELRPWFGTFKVGLELFSAAGPDAVSAVRNQGVDVFHDAKLHDIPTTVGRAARVLGTLGARYVTVHAAGGRAMVRAAVEGLREGAAAVDLPAPGVLAVSVLTSTPEASDRVIRQRVVDSLEAGAAGIVCATPDLGLVRQLAPAAVLVTPGIRPEGAPADDQARVATPRAALESGADLVVVGRPITRAEDHVAAARSLVSSIL